MSTKKYVTLSKLSTFLDKLKTTFASLSHTHQLNDITDYTVDTALSDTSTNPVQNKVLNEEFDSIAAAMNALEAAVDDKASSVHTHSLTDIEEVESTANRTVLGECTSTGSGYISLGSVDFSSLSGKNVTVTVGDTEYEGTCAFDSSIPRYTIDAGDYVISYMILDSMTSITPVPASGTTIKLETVEAATVIPEEYIPTTIARQVDVDGKVDAANPVFTGTFSQNRKSSSDIGSYSHAEGNMTTASGQSSHAEGEQTSATGSISHAEGGYTTASGSYSHAEGNMTTASGNGSHAEGAYTTASGDNQHVQGKYNVKDSDGVYAHIVGNGENLYSLSNAHTLDWEGNAWFAGDVYVGPAGAGNKGDNSKKLITADEVQTQITTAIATKADADHSHSEYETTADASSKLAEAKTYTNDKLAPITTSGTSTAYIATVSGITELTAGVSFIMLPHVESTTTAPTLNVNSLGAKYIRRRLSTNTTTTSAGASDEWLSANKPIRVTYDGTFWIADLQKPSATDLMGAVPIQNGGTGVSSEADFKTLITSTAYQIGGDEPTSGPILWFDTATA